MREHIAFFLVHILKNGPTDWNQTWHKNRTLYADVQSVSERGRHLKFAAARKDENKNNKI